VRRSRVTSLSKTRFRAGFGNRSTLQQ